MADSTGTGILNLKDFIKFLKDTDIVSSSNEIILKNKHEDVDIDEFIKHNLENLRSEEQKSLQDNAMRTLQGHRQQLKRMLDEKAKVKEKNF